MHEKESVNFYPYEISTFKNALKIIRRKGVLEEKLRQQYESENSIDILGAMNYDFLYLYYAICDVFIMPTLEDNWCLVIPEAMAYGKPMACSITTEAIMN